MLRALRLDLPLVVGSADALAEAALFLAIVGFAWPTHGGCQCWETGSQQDGGAKVIGQVGPDTIRVL